MMRRTVVQNLSIQRRLLGLALAAAVSVAACTPDAVPPSAKAQAGAWRTVGTEGNEPVMFAAQDGTLYISALQHLYRSTDGGANWTKLPGPLFAGQLNLASDSSLSMDPGGRLYFNFDWPYAGATAVCTSDDRGESWLCNPSAGPGATDRMWVLAPQDDAAYMVTNEALYLTTFYVSSDRGLSWIPAQFGSGLLEPQTGPLLQKPGGSPRVLQVTKGAGELGFYSYLPSALGMPRSDFRGTGLPAPMALPSAAFTRDGVLYAASEARAGRTNAAVFVTRSTDEGASWTTLPPIPGTTDGTSVFTWIAAGAPGHVGVIFYYTPTRGDPDVMPNAQWATLWAETHNADAAEPNWELTVIDPLVRTGSICIAVSCSGDNRFAGDFISAVIDAQDRAHLAWMANVGAGKNEVRYARVGG